MSDEQADRIATLDPDREWFLLLSWRGAAVFFSEEYERRYDEESTTDANRRLSRFFAVPVLYSFRHFFELRLKRFLRLLGAEAKKVHFLLSMWEKVKSLYLEVAPSSERSLGFADELFLELDRVDAKSQAFRYDTDKKGRRHLTEYDAVNMTSVVGLCLRTMVLLDEMAVDLGLESETPADFVNPDVNTDTNTDTR